MAKNALLLIIGNPAGGLRGIRHIAFIHQDNPGLIFDDFMQLRIPGADRDSRVNNLRHRVHQLQAGLDFSAGFGHMPRKPLNGLRLAH